MAPFLEAFSIGCLGHLPVRIKLNQGQAVRGFSLQNSNMQYIILLIELVFFGDSDTSPKTQITHTAVYGTYFKVRYIVCYCRPIILRNTKASLLDQILDHQILIRKWHYCLRFRICFVVVSLVISIVIVRHFCMFRCCIFQACIVKLLLLVGH